MAMAAAAPTARVSVATAMITNIRRAVSRPLDERAAGGDGRDGGAELGGLAGPDREQRERGDVAPATCARE